MPTTHVCLISEQPIPNLLPLLIEKPEQVIFLVSPQMTSPSDRLQRLLQPRGIKVITREIPAFDFAAVVACCEEAAQEAKATGADLVLNVTGGTKIAALAAFQVFYFNNHRIIYLDTSNNQILQISPEPISYPLQKNYIKTKDYLAAYGMTPTNIVSGNIPRRPALREIAELLIGDTALLSQLNSAIARHNSKKGQAAINLNLNGLGNKTEQLATALTASGAAQWTSSANLHIASPEDIFFCQGGWLEEYVYWSVKDLNIKNLDLARNVQVEWDGKGKAPTENEFDVLFTHNNRLHLISCKTSDPDRQTPTGDKATESLNELDTLADRTGGLFVRAMLVSARGLRAVDRERAKKMKIELVDGPEVLHLKDRLQSWLTPRKTN